jgi:hypothetical protein
MTPLFIFLGIVALFFVCAYELVTSAAKYPKSKPRAQWPEKGGK